jgi:hypothetical protein
MTKLEDLTVYPLPWKYTHIVHYVIYIIPGMNIITEGNTLSHYQYRALCTHKYK